MDFWTVTVPFTYQTYFWVQVHLKYNGLMDIHCAISVVENLHYVSSNNQFCLPSNSLRVGDYGDSTKSAIATA